MKTKKFNDLSQLASLKEKMEVEDQQYYTTVREKESQEDFSLLSEFDRSIIESRNSSYEDIYNTVDFYTDDY